MNILGTIISVQKFNKVHYYTIHVEGEDNALFEQFVARHGTENRDKLNHVLAWMKRIGIKYGAKEQNFRAEAAASALPPKGRNREPHYIPAHLDTDEAHVNDIRLYCFRANERVVFLFDGDIKQARTPQECPNVARHFKLANTLSRALDRALIEREIQWNEDATDLIIPDGYTLRIEER